MVPAASRRMTERYLVKMRGAEMNMCVLLLR